MTSSTERVLELFQQINEIPRCSTKEKALSDWLVKWAEERGFGCEQDGVYNLLIRVPGSGGAASAPPVALQGHLDMVCEKSPDSSHNFDTDPIRATTQGEWLSADRTSLGADNGIALALALALAEDTAVSHPPLELVFTVDEESGLTGAQKLSPTWLEAKVLLNLDSEDEGVLTVGCAGGLNSILAIPAATVVSPPELVWVELRVSGLKGGHSGVDIHLGRGNANVILARTLADLRPRFGVAVAEIHGGSAHNAIPRDARALLGVTADRADDLRAAVVAWHQTALAEHHLTDPELAVELVDAERPERVFEESAATRVVRVLMGLPHGVVRMSKDIEGLVETSTNLATIRTSDGKIDIDTSQRSSLESQLEAVAGTVRAVAELGEGSVRITARYPAWEPLMESPLLEKARDVYRRLFDTEPVVEVIHAGLECGVIGAKYPGMQMLSLGPTIQMPHSPDERLNVPSLDRVWEFLVQLLAELK